MTARAGTTAAPRDGGALNPDDFRPGLRFALKALGTGSVRRAQTPDDVLPVCFAHNLRQHNDGHRHRRPIDPRRTAHNTVMRGAPRVHELVATVRDTLEATGAKPRRRDCIVGVEYVTQAPEGGDRPDFWAACLEFIEQRGLPVVHAVVHRDQARPHMHVIALALDGGRFAGAALTSGSNRLQAQQRDFSAFMRARGWRADRPAKSPAITKLALSTGKGPRRHAEAERADAAFERRAARPHGCRPHSPRNLLARDLMAPTSYCVQRFGAQDMQKQLPDAELLAVHFAVLRPLRVHAANDRRYAA